MATFLDKIFRLSTGMAESALLLADSALRGVQAAVDRVAGQEPGSPPVDPPFNGPVTIDDATSELSNQLLRIAWTTPLQGDALLTAWRDVLHSVRSSFGGLDLRDARKLAALPLRIPLSYSSLLTQQSIRGLHTAAVVGPERLLKFVSYMTASFTDTHLFMSLQYQKQVRRYRDHLQRHPEDDRTRYKLGKMYIKMGLYSEAVRELSGAAEDPALRADALHECTVANYKGARYEQAVADGVAALTADPSNLSTKWWLFLAADALGGYTAEVPTDLRLEVQAGRHPSKVRFEEVAEKIGLDKTSGGRGTAVFDLDGNGYLDVAISSAHGGVSLYRNRGDGTFDDITVGSGLDECVNAHALAVGDYNNDGLDDIYVTRLGFYVGDSVLYRNNGDGTFTDVTKETGLGCWGPSFTAQWVDYDCDGHLDLFLANNQSGIFDRKNPNRLFHNNGDGTFTEVSEKAGLHSMTPTTGSAWGDYNNDGFPDLFLSAGVGRSQLYRNNGDGTFTDVSATAGIDDICFGSVAFWLDYDNDGWLDLVQFVWSPEEDVIHTLVHGEGPSHGHPMRIYHNNRDGTFTRRDRELGLTGCFGTMSGNAGDFNNDGRMDFLLGNGDPHMDRTEPAIIFEDDGTGSYRNVTFAAGLPYVGKSHGSNLADLSGDGRLSLIIAGGGVYPADLMTTTVFRPIALPGNYLNVRLVGTRSNRNAIGARLRIDAGGRSQHRLVSGGTGFGCLPYEQHVGLADLGSVEALEITWPSGLKQRIEKLPVNQTIRIVEGNDSWEPVYHSGRDEHAG